MSYGIGRVPRDVDPTDEAMAEIEAIEIMASQAIIQATERERHILNSWQCTEHWRNEKGEIVRCPERTVNLTIYRSNTPGGAVLCEHHWLAHHRHSLRMPNASVEDIIEYWCELAKRAGPCDICGEETNNWVSGAGRYLCHRHEDDY